ncbi:MAG: amidohydrolase, partial [Acidobacteriota bacterium]|nr:amidohydrolase [Acidobacteriota bacterium]
LVLLDKNPFEDIHNTQSIAAVIIGGRVLSRSTLDGILAGAARAAKSEAVRSNSTAAGGPAL